jgi:nucleotide-binding universal stress UspA family protein
LKILLAVDGSLHSDMAVETLRALQLPSETQVSVLNVVHEHTFLGGITVHRFRENASTKKHEREPLETRAAGTLDGVARRLKEGGLDPETKILWGNPAEQIIQHAGNSKSDLVILGAKGLSDSERFPLGSVAQKVMKYCPASVLLVRKGGSKLKKIMFATDGSRHSDAAAGFLVELPVPPGAKIFVVTSLESHIAALVSMPTLDWDTNQRILAELRAAEEKAARDLLEKTRQRFQDSGYPAECLVLRGDPSEEITLAARTVSPNLVVVGAKGQAGVESFLLGSVAQRVARFCRYSVLIVRTKGHGRSP